MSEEETVVSEQSTVTSEQEETAVSEKLVPVSEAIRYRKRAQAAEKELGELKERLEQQQAEFEEMKQEVEALNTCSTSQDSSLIPHVSTKTQGVKESRTGGARTMLQTAARQAVGTGSRADVQAYLRLRRQYV
jgi:hypothetical protein